MSAPTQTCTLCGRVEVVRMDGRGFPPDIAKRRLRKACKAAGCPSEPQYRAGLWWAILDRWPKTPVAVVPPANRAKWATGKGNADKAAVAAVAARLCPDVDLPSSDAADALILALMGAHALGERPDMDTAYRRDALCKCEWPPDITRRVLEPYAVITEINPEETR